jgi:hypothetical protein
MRESLFCRGIVALMMLAIVPTMVSAQDYLTPTKQHEALAEDVGTWDGDVTLWPAAGAEPMKSKGVETNEMFGKMWLMSKYDGDMGGEKFSGRSAIGYDPVKKKFYGGWVDTMSPFMMKLEGDYDEALKTLTMTGDATSVMTGKDEKFKLVTKWEDKDKKTFEIYGTGEDGKEWKMMETKYTRRK